VLNNIVSLEVAILVRELGGVVSRLGVVRSEGLDDGGISLLGG
jgi:hypothetical protein